VAPAAQKRSYHHGNLPAALVDAALELIGEHGVQGFSVAEAARRTGVSISAPYRHFADREDLIAACAVAACEEMRKRFAAAVAEADSPADQLAAASAAYVRFAAERRSMFEALFGAGLDKTKYPQLQAAVTAVIETVLGAARELAPKGDDESAAVLLEAMTGLAQGHATLLLDGRYGDMPQGVDLACERVAAATRALVRGRSLLFSPAAAG
jgi:AcrR family transcriptional regulator